MKVTPSKLFVKHSKHLTASQQETLKQRIDLFLDEPFHPILHNHALRGKLKGCRSLNMGGDLRLIFEYVSKDEILLIDIGSHAQLYE